MPRPAVNLEIDARDRTRRAFESASRRIDTLTGGATKLNRLFAGGLGIAAVGAAVGAATLAVRRLIGALQETVDRLDEIDKASRAADIDGETLQSWRLFGELAGATSQQVDTSLRRIRRRSGEALQGGEVAKSFEELGISMAFLRENSENVGAIVLEIAERLATAEDRTKAFASAVRIGDIEFARFAQGLIDGGADFDEMNRRWRAMGLIIPNEVLPQVTAAKDRMTELNAAIQTQKDLLLIGLTPALEGALGVYLIWRDRLKRVAEYHEAINLALRARAHLIDTGAADRQTGTFEEATSLPGFAELAQESAREQAEAAKARRLTYDLFLAEVDAEVKALVKTLRSPFEEETARQLASLRGIQAIDEQAGALFNSLRLQEETTREIVQAETERLRNAGELAGLSGEELVRARHRIDLARLDKRIREETNPLVRQDLETQREVLIVTQQRIESVETQNDLLREQHDILGDIGGLLANFEDSTEGWVRALGQALAIWQRFSEQGGSGASGFLRSLGAFFSGGGIQAPAMVPAPAGGAGGAQSASLTQNVIFQGVDYGADFRRHAIEAADVIFAGQQDFAARRGLG